MSALALLPTPAPEVDLDIQRLVLDVTGKKAKGLDTHVERSVTDATLERTMDGASTLTVTVHDPKRALLQSGMFAQPVQVTLDSLTFRLVKVSKQGDDLTLTFEDRAVAALRQHTHPRHISRDKVTRAQFALSLVREVRPRIQFVCPELHVRQPVQGVSGKADKRHQRKALPYQFRRGGTDGSREDSWTCLQRLAQEVQWRCFASSGAVWFISEPELLKRPPRISLTEQSVGVSSVDFDVDNGKVRSEVQLACQATRWEGAPGEVVRLSGLGPADGLWLVADTQRSLFATDASITLKRATTKLPEPAPDTATVPTTGGKVSSGKHRRASGSSPAEKAWNAALSIDQHHYPYVWGGGHSRAGQPSGGGYDCSGSVCAVLAAAGLGFHPGGPVSTSGALMSWGAAGQGQGLTVYASVVHTFIVFHTSSGDVHFGTGRWGKSWGGAGMNPSMHPTAGFAARHWPGV